MTNTAAPTVKRQWIVSCFSHQCWWISNMSQDRNHISRKCIKFHSCAVQWYIFTLCHFHFSSFPIRFIHTVHYHKSKIPLRGLYTLYNIKVCVWKEKCVEKRWKLQKEQELLFHGRHRSINNLSIESSRVEWIWWIVISPVGEGNYRWSELVTVHLHLNIT